MDELLWARKNKVLVLWLAGSVALNLGLVANVLHSTLKQPKILHSSPTPLLSSTTGEILSHFFYLGFEDLVEKLGDKRLVEDGYAVRDLALSCLVGFHHFDCDRALPAPLFQRRKLSFIHTEGGELVEVPVFPSLSDDHFKAISLFAQREKWPFTAEGLFAELKRDKEAPESLKETFLLTPAFEAFASRIQGAPSEALQLALEGDFESLTAPGERVDLLLRYVEQHRSPKAAELLLREDRDFVVRKSADQGLIALLQVSKDTNLARETRLSLRGDGVRHAAAELLGIGAVEMPAPAEVVAPQKIHVIQPGDSLWKISRLYKVSIKKLAETNGLSEEGTLRPGKTLKIP